MFCYQILNPATMKHQSPYVPASSISIKEQSSSLVLCCNDRWAQWLQAQRHSQGSCSWSVGSETVSATQTCNGTHSDYKVFCRREEGEEEEGVRKSMGRKLKSRANCGACFLSMPLTAQCSWLCLSRFPSVLTSLACSDCLFLSGEERRRERGGNKEEEEASFHSDGWWKRTRQVLLGCTPLFFLPSLCFFQDAPFSFSFWIHPSISNLHITGSHLYRFTYAGCFPVLLSEFLLIIQTFVSHPFEEEKQTHKNKGRNQQQKSPFTLSFFSTNWPHPILSISAPHSLAHLPLFLFPPAPRTTWVIIFPPHPSFKTQLPLSITWRSFRSVAWSNAPQRCTWNRGHTRLIHHFPPTIASPAPPITPPKCSSFMHAPVSFHSCSFSLLYRSPPLLPHFLAFSRSFITEGIYPPNPPTSLPAASHRVQCYKTLPDHAHI